MPVLGILASSNYQRLTTAYESIATVTPYTTTTTVTFSSIPSTYTHLQIRATSNYGSGAANNNFWLQFNGDTAANYFWHQFYGNGVSSVGLSGAALNRNEIYCGVLAGTSSSYASSTIIDILDYANTNKFKTIRTLGGMDGNGSGNINVNSGAWQNTAAITRIDLTSQSFNFVQYSSFALYGIKGV